VISEYWLQTAESIWSMKRMTVAERLWGGTNALKCAPLHGASRYFTYFFQSLFVLAILSRSIQRVAIVYGKQNAKRVW